MFAGGRVENDSDSTLVAMASRALDLRTVMQLSAVSHYDFLELSHEASCCLGNR